MSKINKPRSWAIYGRAGSGKTTFSATFPKPMLYVDVRDEGTDSISDVEGIMGTEVTDRASLEKLYWYLHANPNLYKTVVIDTVSQLQQVVVEEIGEKKVGKSGKQAGDWGVMTKQDWGDVASYLKTWLTNFRDLPMEVVFLAQDRSFNIEDEEGNDSETEVGPRLSPSVSSHLCAAVSIIGNTFTKSRVIKKKVNGKTIQKERTDYCLRIGPNPVFMTKIRKPKSITLPPHLVDPSYQAIIDLINGAD